MRLSLEVFTFMLGSGPSVDCPSLQAGLIFILLAERDQDCVVSPVSHLAPHHYWTGHTLITPQSSVSISHIETQLSTKCSFREWEYPTTTTNTYVPTDLNADQHKPNILRKGSCYVSS